MQGNWLCAVLLIVGCDEVESWGEADASVPRMAEADEPADTACDDDSDCRKSLEPGIRGLRDSIHDNLAAARSEAELREGERLLAAIDAEELVGTIDAIDAARSACYSALTGTTPHSLIMVPLPSPSSNLDATCHVAINAGWHAGGIAKGRYFNQDCGAPLENQLYGGGYTAFVPEGYFEANPALYPSCGSSNAFICCSPQFPN
ncbi:hypothetical protein [Paraliomyxa miuraensis]|uniref:hypothetical protein n=1 Tax=Paraliomyxa miuraensis TaxID=376150 RepID=UPI0022565362|nr:hypothetical protein [Paraliomyxa miuraensis]MCX4247805.1 hypothetical protein [Paraliomyxa miuraensis]